VTQDRTSKLSRPEAAIPGRSVPFNPPSGSRRFGGLGRTVVDKTRTLYFSEVLAADPRVGPNNFYITVDGQTPALFNPNNPPGIVTTQGSVEDWTIQNRALQTHIFHIHQLHFLVVAINGVPVPNGQYVDTVEVPYWPGTGPYPSVTLRMDFRQTSPGDFVYHCHILSHEDMGMMAIIRVNGR
jgi:FtsP/CotA-like multicopper oxidase with cupredoxin domain